MATARTRRPKDLRAGTFQAAINSFILHLNAEGKSGKTVRTYAEAAQWFAAEHLRPNTEHSNLEDVTPDDVRAWMVHLLGQYSQLRQHPVPGLQQFFKWWSTDEELPDPMAKLSPPSVGEKVVPVFTDEELAKLLKNCEGKAFTQRRDYAILALPPAGSCCTRPTTDLEEQRERRFTPPAGTVFEPAGISPDGRWLLEPVEPEMVSYHSADGRDVHALLYRPHGPGPHPVLLSIHGGPEAQERPVYARAGLYQYLLAQGIAVFAPNIAGSTGYGTVHQKLIYRDWGGADLTDLHHAVRYLHTLGWIAPDRIAVAGASYGGFAALSCLARLTYPWAAGVSICGPSNLVTLAQASPPTWKPFVDTILGDPDTEADRLLEHSPVTHADDITAPLFILQGARDPRVPQAESDQIVHRLRQRGVEVRYDVYPDEGHGFTNRDNELDAYNNIADFLTGRLL